MVCAWYGMYVSEVCFPAVGFMESTKYHHTGTGNTHCLNSICTSN